MVAYSYLLYAYSFLFPVEIKGIDYALNPPAHCQPDHSAHCKFPLRSNGENHVQCDIKNSSLAVVSFDVQHFLAAILY